MYCRMNRVECRYADMNGYCDSTACHNMNLLANCHNLEDDTLPTQENKTQSDWHTGTPTEEGWYLIEAKDWEKQRVYYVPDYVSVHDLVLPTVQSFYESHLWQKIELSDEAKDLEQKITPFETNKEN